MARQLSILSFLLVSLLVVGCGGRRAETTPRPGADAGPPPTGCVVGGPTIVCAGNQEITCNTDGSVGSTRLCSDDGLSCAPDIGCAVCTPGRGGCDGNVTTRCAEDGMSFSPVENCDDRGQQCDPNLGVCTNLCEMAEASNSYIGCEYWPTPVINPVADEFDFAVVVANPQTVTATISVERAGTMVTTTTVQPGDTKAIRLPWVDALKNPIAGSDEDQRVASALVRGGAYRLSSSVPVTVYQFSPLEYEINTDCTDEVGGDVDGLCNSFSNDASLLVPSHVLSGNYIALSWLHRLQRTRVRDKRDGTLVTDPDTGELFEIYSQTPGFVAIVAVDSGTVQVRAGGRVEASADGAVSEIRPGASATFSLNAGDVLQLVTAQAPETCDRSDIAEDERTADCGLVPCTAITKYCAVDDSYDLTGTEIRSSGRVAVISGHMCAFVPYYRWACDHLEESMFPLEAWGEEIVVSTTQPLRSEPNLIRVVSGGDGNNVTFEPAVQSPVTLDRGEFVEFEASAGFRVTGSEALTVGQFLVGQDYSGIATAGMMGRGDPAMSLGIPTEQFRSDYTFLAPTTFEQSFVGVTAATGQQVLLDGVPINSVTPIGSTGMGSVQVEVSGGQHRITSDSPFGIVVYGFAPYTSYMVPGGLDLEEINAPF